jgi:ATP-dependent DNA helicase RecQ
VASFNRPNLSYRVSPKRRGHLSRSWKSSGRRSRESGIIYCQSRKSTGVGGRQDLVNAGFAARAESRRVSRIANARRTGGHFSATTQISSARRLPSAWGSTTRTYVTLFTTTCRRISKDIYQRLGRRGATDCRVTASCCSRQETFGKYLHLSTRSRTSANGDTHGSSSTKWCTTQSARGAARTELLAYFGEKYPDANCGACDNCVSPRDTYDGTVPAQKLLSSIIRARNASRDRAASLDCSTTSTSCLVKRTNALNAGHHDQLSTFGIGADLTRHEWSAIGRELLRLGFLEQATGEYATLEITENGLAALRNRESITLTRATCPPQRVPDERKRRKRQPRRLSRWRRTV